MTTPADSNSPNPFAPNFRTAEQPSLSISDYDALADLFLGDEPDGGPADDHTDRPTAPPMPGAHAPPVHPFMPPTPPMPDTKHAPTIEAAIVGHLPVRASLWVMQHARDTADSTGETVAVLRATGDELAIDLLAPSATRRSFNTFDAKSLDDALALASRTATRWIISADELSEPQLLASDRVQAVSLLTSASRAATVAAYRTLKHAVGSADDAEDRSFRFVIMGSEPDDASRAATQLRHVTEAFLGRPVDVVTGASKIDATRAVPLFRGRLEAADADLLALIERARELPAEADEKVGGPVIASREPEPTTVATEATDTDLRLCSLLSGLTDLALRCPIEPQVQLALDDDGRIHLLASDESVADPVRSLTQAGAWAALNRELILAAAKHDSPTDADEPVLHLLVHDAPTNRRLLDADIRLHLLRRIPVEDAEPVWFSAPLN